jgi:hypothetical protein
VNARAHIASWLAVWLALQTAVAPTAALDLFAFRDGFGRVLAFAVPAAEPIPATVDQAGATQAAVDWARRFYHLDDLAVVAVEFETRPTRFWRVTFLVSEHGRTVHLYAVLPDGRPVEPTARDET